MNWQWAIISIVAMALIGVGLYFIYAPAAPLGIGLLLWLDMSIEKLLDARRTTP